MSSVLLFPRPVSAALVSHPHEAILLIVIIAILLIVIAILLIIIIAILLIVIITILLIVMIAILLIIRIAPLRVTYTRARTKVVLVKVVS